MVLLYLEHMKLCSMLCGSLDERGVWGRVNICMAESLLCSLETITTLLTGYTPTHNNNLKKIDLLHLIRHCA